MSLVDQDGYCRTNRSLTRPDRRLVAGCDKDKIYDAFMFGIPALFISLMNFNWLGILIIIAALVAWISYLRILGKQSPYFFPIYKRASREQTVYYRSSHFGARIRPTPVQQEQKEV